jgi:hypothetical protein
MSEFKTYRAVTKIHLGQIERDLYEGDIVEFNGTTLKIGGESFQLGSLRAAVSKNWLVDANDSTSKYVPQSANIGVRKATDAGSESTEKTVIKTVNDEEKVVGSSTRMSVENKDTNDDAVEIGKVKTATKQKSVLKDGASVDAEINRLDNTTLKSTIIKREDQEIAKSLSVDEAQQAFAEVEPVANQELESVKGEVNEIKGQLASMMDMMSQMMTAQQTLLIPPAPVPAPVIEEDASANVSVDDANEFQDLLPDAEVLGSNLLKTASEELSFDDGFDDDDFDESLDLDGSLSEDFDFFGDFDEGDLVEVDEEFEEEPAFINEDMEPIDLQETLAPSEENEEASAPVPNSISDRMIKLSNGDVWDMTRHYNTRASDLINNYLDNPILDEILSLEVNGVRKRVANAMSSAVS